MAGEKDDGYEDALVCELLLQLEPVQFRHRHVQHETRVFSGRYASRKALTDVKPRTSNRFARSKRVSALTISGSSSRT